MHAHRYLMAALSALVLFATGSAYAAPSCNSSKAVWGGFPTLSRTFAALRNDQLRIVAVGSSSTQGTGASTPERTYPAQLDQVLEKRFPGDRIEVFNRGIGGEKIQKHLVRFSTDVLALKPDLVIWQIGTNDALQNVSSEAIRAGLLDGIARIRVAGADVVLLDPQPLPQPEREATVARVRAVLVDVAASAKVALLPRHQLMTYWLSSGQFTPATLIGPDGLHMTDASYYCLAERIADLFPAGIDDNTPGKGRVINASVTAAAPTGKVRVSDPAVVR